MLIESLKQNTQKHTIRVIGAAVLVISLAATFYLWNTLRNSSINSIQQTLKSTTHLVRVDVEQYVKTQIYELQRMAQRWEIDGGTARRSWQADAKNYVAENKGLRTIEWVDNTYHVRWIEPLEGNEKALGLNIIFDDQRKKILTGASIKKTITLTPPLDLIQGYKAFIVYIPIYVEDKFDGFIVGIFDIKQLLDTFLASKLTNNQFTEVLMSDIDTYQHGDKKMIANVSYMTEEIFTLYNIKWTLRVTPYREFIIKTKQLPNTVLGFGIALSSLLAIAIYYLLRALQSSQMHQAAEDKLRSANEKTEMALAALREHKSVLEKHAIVAITDIKGNITYANDMLCKVSGYSREELIGQNHRILKSGIHDNQVFKDMWRTIARGQVWNGDLCNRAKDGHYYWVRTTIVPTLGTNNKPISYVAIRTEITEGKIAEQNLQRSETLLRNLFELSPVGIALNDFETGAFIRANNALIEPTGYTHDEFIKLNYWDLTPKEYEPMESQQLESLRQSGHYGPYEKEYITKHGIRYPVLLNGVLITDPLNNKKMIWSIVEDISERKRIEKMKNEFVSTVSHELRTPLTSISGALGLLSGGALGILPDDIQKMIDIAHKNSKQLTFLINDLLDMEKLAAGKMDFHLRQQRLLSLIKQAIESILSYAQKFDVSLVLENSIPEIVVMVDSDRLMQVLSNLLSNAIKFSPKNGKVSISMKLQNRTVRITVTDQGAGIPAKFHSQIFQKFAQADSSDSRQKGGTGLGLAISRELMIHMGGTIGFESKEGKGSSFYFELPTLIE